MDTRKNIPAEELLNSLDGCQRATVSPYFYTRLKAKMQSLQDREMPMTKSSWIVRPAYAFSLIIIVLLINAVVIFRGNGDTQSSNQGSYSEIDNLQSMASEYSLADNNNLYFTNQDK
jgi:hypothetical protein